MACEYFVNGNWVTEDQLKEILNNGLLDNLVSSNKIQIAGFKPDPAKLLKTTKEVIERKTVPARKLADILANEVKTRAGYSLNILSALELNIVKNPDGTVNEELTDFKIPLWASPYAQKFESLLTSIISKKVVKTKAPGNSYVLGSQEGFKIKEGDEAAGSLSDSGIVFTDSFDPAVGLQPMRYDEATGKILPDQIMIPFKFRDEQGKILNLKNFTIKGPDGKIMLDNGKIPAKLLKLMGYRIPTGGRNQMATIEIVGFLPEASGDLVLAPRDFTKRMGSDFDVDKLYTYNYNHFYDSESGQIKMNFLSDQKKIDAAIEVQKDKINALKSELKLSKKEIKVIDEYIKNKLIGPQEEEEFEENQRIEEEAMEIINAAMSSDAGIQLAHAFDILSVLKRSYKASRENNIQDIRLQILESTTPEILASNLGLDSYGEFESLAPEVDRIRRSRGLVPGITTILSDVYQRNKYINATAGKDGVGSFSLDSTFNIAVQGKELTLLNLSKEASDTLFGSFTEPRTPTAAEILEYNTPLAIFGNSISKGDLSDKYTLRSQAIIKAAAAENRPLTDAERDSLKLKSTIIKSLQSTSVDNEKFQILDKLNINTNTFDAIRAMTMLGFEEEDIAGLLTQEIIWEFVDKLINAQSSLVAYNPNAQADIFTELLKKYDPEDKFLELTEDKQLEWGSASGEELLKDLESQTLKPLKEGDITPDFNLKQVAILSKFVRLTEIGAQIKQLQSTVNTGSKGLPKSILEVQAKAKQINELEKSPIFNASKLLGVYTNTGLQAPTTINGFASYYGTLFGNTIYNKFFPYNTQGFESIAEEIFMHIPNAADKSLGKQTEMRRDIFEDMRSFLYANTESNLFGEDPDAERRRLFIDVVEGPYKNMSLAKILSTLSTQSWFQKNGFLNKLDFDLNTNGTISRINFEAAAAENLDERNIYSGFLYLLDKNFPVGTFNGVEYTSRTLAQELVAAAFLEGGNQGSKQYLKYVPTSYLKTLGFGNYLGNITFDFQGEFYGNANDNGIIYTAPSRFARQYFQNNPDKVKTVTLTQLEGQETEIPETFTLNEKALANNFIEVPDPFTGEMIMEQIRFLSIYDSKLPGKYALYEFDSADRIYRRIPVLLGSYGFVQYNSDSSMPTPVETGNRIPTVKPDIVPPGYSVPGAPVQPTKGFDIDVVNNPTSTLMAKDLIIAKDLNNTKAALDDLINVLQDAEGISSLNHLLLDQLRDLKLPEDFTVSYIRDNYQRSGSYDSDSHTLEINLNTINLITSDRLATIVAHELIHAHTAEAIYDYQKGELDKLSAKQIEIIKNLEALQQQYIKYLDDTGSTEELKRFTESYRRYKAKQSTAVEGDVSKLYGAMKLTEFVTMALTDKGFQTHLNNIIDAKGVSLWEKIKQLFSELLQAIGMDIPAGSALASAIKETMDLISATQENISAGSTMESFKYYGAYYDIKIVDGVATDVVNLKKNASETNVRFQERKNKILAAFKQDPTTDPQNARKPITLVSPTTPPAPVSAEPNKITPEKQAVIDMLAENGIHLHYMDGTYDVLGEDGVIAEYTSLEEAIQIGVATLEEKRRSQTNEPVETPTPPPAPAISNNLKINGITINTGDITVNPQQLKALQNVANFIDSVVRGNVTDVDISYTLAGYAGTGKTTITKFILQYLNKKGKNYEICSPTHRAKEVLSDATGEKARTLAQVLGLSAGVELENFNLQDKIFVAKNKDKVPSGGILVIDEASMINDALYKEVIQIASKKGTKVLFIGDDGQLKPVKQIQKSQPFRRTTNISKLTQVMRTADGNPMPAEVLQPIRDNPLSRVDMFDHTTKLSDKGEGIEFTNDQNQWTQEMLAEFTIEKFAKNPNHARALAYTNARVKDLNQMIRTNMFGFGAERFYNGELLMMYENLFYNMATQDYDFSNGADVKVVGVEYKDNHIIKSSSGTEFKVKGYLIKLVDAKTNKDKKHNLFIADMNLVDKDYLHELARLKTVALNAPVNLKAVAWADYYKFSSAYNLTDAIYEINGYILPEAEAMKVLLEQNPQATKATLGRYKAKDKSVDYAYSHTIHKSQGGTYEYAFVDENNIDVARNFPNPDYELINQLKYVGFSRSSKKTVVLSGKTGTAAAPVVPRQKLDMSGLSDPTKYTTPPSATDFESQQEEYRPEPGLDESLEDSVINRDDYENYLLICGK